MQFRTVAAPDGAQLDALIVPVFKEGGAASGTPAADRETAEWVAREQGSTKIFSIATHLRASDGEGATRLVVVAAGRREEYDIQRAWEVVSAGVRALWSSTTKTVGVCSRHAGSAGCGSRPGRGRRHPLRAVATRHAPHRRGGAPAAADSRMCCSSRATPRSTPTRRSRRGTAVGEAVNWARSLANEPANLMTPTHVAAGGHASWPSRPACRSRSSTRTPVARWAWAAFCQSPTAVTSRRKFIVLRHQGRARRRLRPGPRRQGHHLRLGRHLDQAGRQTCT